MNGSTTSNLSHRVNLQFEVHKYTVTFYTMRFVAKKRPSFRVPSSPKFHHNYLCTNFTSKLKKPRETSGVGDGSGELQ